MILGMLLMLRMLTEIIGMIHVMRNDKPAPVLKGNAFCFHSLPAKTGFPVHINGYFELSTNKRDIWFGSDMTEAGQICSDWNQLLLQDVIAPLYNQVLLCAQSFLGFGESYDRSLLPLCNGRFGKITSSAIIVGLSILSMDRNSKLEGQK